MKKLIEIQSVSDIITNSSTELFVAEISQELIKEAKKIGFDLIYFNTPEDITKYIKENDYYTPDLDEYLRYNTEISNIECTFSIQNCINFIKVILNKTTEEALLTILPFLEKHLLGKAFFAYCDEDYGLSNKEYNFISKYMKMIERY